MHNLNSDRASVNTHADTDRVLFHLSHYVRLGWAIIPAHGVILDWPDRTRQACTCRDGLACPSPGKHPDGKWKDRPVLTLRDLLRARAETQSRTGGFDPNWAVRLGRSGLAALDVDTHADGPDGAAAWAQLEAQHGPLPATPRDSRGHALFRLPDAATLAGWPTKIDLAPGVELFTGSADGTGPDHILYIPPSQHPGGTSYRWLPGLEPWTVEPTELPAWMVDRAAAMVRAAKHEVATAPRSAAVVGGFTGYAAGGSDVLSRARAYLAKCPGAVEGSGGDNHTFKVACRLVVDFGLTPGEAFPLLAEWNATCVPPWTDADLSVKLTSANQRPAPRGKLRDADRPRRGLLDCDEFRWLKTAGDTLIFIRPKQKGPRRDRRPLPAGPCLPAGGDGAAHMGECVDQWADMDAPANRQAGEDATREAAEAAAARRACDKYHNDRRCRFECQSPSRTIMQHRTNRTVQIIYARCDRWTCSGCGALRRERWRDNVRLRIEAFARPTGGDVVLYAATVPAKCWPTVAKRLRRANASDGADYFRWGVKGCEEYYVVATAPVFAGFGQVELSPAAAVDQLTARIDAFYDAGQPMSSSKPWALVKRQSKLVNEFVRRGMLPPTTPEWMVDDMFADIPFAAVEDKVTADPNSRVRRRRFIRFAPGTPDATVDLLISRLRMGEMLPAWPDPDDDDDDAGGGGCRVDGGELQLSGTSWDDGV